jgi:hypothetical protein
MGKLERRRTLVGLLAVLGSGCALFGALLSSEALAGLSSLPWIAAVYLAARS